MKNIFNSNICTGKISLNPRYITHMGKLISNLKKIFSQEYIELFYWAYRVNETVGYSIQLSNRDNSITYDLTINEGNDISFSDYSFISDEGEITVLDSVDAISIIHYILCKLPNAHLVSFPDVFNS